MLRPVKSEHSKHLPTTFELPRANCCPEQAIFLVLLLEYGLPNNSRRLLRITDLVPLVIVGALVVLAANRGRNWRKFTVAPRLRSEIIGWQ